MTRKIVAAFIAALSILLPLSSRSANYMRDITIAADGSGDFRTFGEALEAIRAFMDYKVTVHIKNGVYNEKVIIPAWLENVDFIGESADGVIIRQNDYAGLNNMGTFRTYTVRVDGKNLNFRNMTIENTAGRVGQAVALHTEGDNLNFENVKLKGNQDTLYTGGRGTFLNFKDCYIEGTTDFIFGPSTAWFENCDLHSKMNSYVTAASTPADTEYGYIFKNCRLTADPGVDKVYLGRPWRPYANTYFIDCEMGPHITAAGWHNWNNADNERTARYGESGSRGEGARGERVAWAKKLSKKEADAITPEKVFCRKSTWKPAE